jgi:hypothetical protein
MQELEMRVEPARGGKIDANTGISSSLPVARNEYGLDHRVSPRWS